MHKPETTHANVSVIIPCFRCADTVTRAVHSVATQTLLPHEIILVDDASNDDTLQTLTAIKAAHNSLIPINIIALQENGGAGVARNRGWDMAKCDYIAFLDADDTWHSEKLSIQYRWMMQHADVDLSCHLSEVMDNQTAQTDPKETNSIRLSPNKLIFQNKVATRTVMMKRLSPFRFDAKKRLSEDYFLWLTMAFSDCEMVRLDHSLAYSYKPHFGHSGLTQNLVTMELSELDTFYQLFKTKLLSFPWLFLAMAFSLVKFLRRLLQTLFTKGRK